MPVRFWNGTVQGRGTTTDVSATGCFVETDTPVPLGTRLHLELSLPSGPFFAEALVTRAVRGQRPDDAGRAHGMGLRLLAVLDALDG